MKKIVYPVIVGVLCVLCVIIYAMFFTLRERHARYIRNNEQKIALGMTVSMVEDILSKPDTIYTSFDWGPKELRPFKVLEYYRGFASADNLRVLVKGDTVVEVVSPK